MKKVVKIFMILTLLVTLSACTQQENANEYKTVPLLENVETNDGKNVLTSMGLIPVVQENYSDTVPKGQIISTEPPYGSQVNENERIIVYVSKGPSYIESKNSVIEWFNVTYKQDEWEFYSPYIQQDTLYIDCEVVFAASMKWNDPHNNGYGYGQVSVNDNFDKVVPVKIKFDNQSHNANEKQNITLEVPLNDLQIERPTDLYFKLSAIVNGNANDISVNFTMSW